MKRAHEEDHFDIVEMASSNMNIKNLEQNIGSLISLEIDMKIRAILHVILLEEIY